MLLKEKIRGVERRSKWERFWWVDKAGGEETEVERRGEGREGREGREEREERGEC